MDVTPQADIPYIMEQLRDKGGVTLTMRNGKRLFIVTARNLGLDEKGALVSGDGGSMYWHPDKKVNQFQLISNGFSIKIAEHVSNLLNSMLTHLENVTNKDIGLAISAAPKGTENE
jgi:hypothetical protein